MKFSQLVKNKLSKLNLKQSLLIALSLRFLILLFSQSHPDIGNHLDWGNRFLNLGPERFYENIFWNVSWPNQPLGSILLFALVSFLKTNIFNFFAFINQSIPAFPSFIIPILEKNLHTWLVKLPFILADLGIAKLIYDIVKQRYPKKALLAASFFLFNPLVIYNSTVWGQTDSLINLLALSGIYFTYQKKYLPGIILFLSSFLFKLSLIIYLPVFGILILKNLKDWKKMISPILIFTVSIYLIALPFRLGDKGSFQWLWYMYTNRVLVRQGSMLNGNAYNFWFLIFGLDFSQSEFTKLSLFTYQTWSRLAFIVILIPILIKALRNKLSLTNLLSAFLLSAFAAFVLLTNMHERYLYPIFPIFSILIFLSPKIYKLKDFLLLSLFHLLNLYNLWFYPQIRPLKSLLTWHAYLSGRIISLILLIYFVRYYYQHLQHEA